MLRRYRNLVLRCFVLLSLLGSGAARADFPLTILKTRHQSAEVLAPRLADLVSPGGRINGINNTLLIRTDPTNLAELQAVLAEIDRPAQRLRIRVRSTLDADSQRREIGAGGEIGNDDVRIRLPDSPNQRNTRIEIGSVRIDGNDSTRQARQGGEQFVDTIDGGRASVFLGQSIPMRFSQVFFEPDGARVVRGTTWRDVGSGLVATPELRGRRVVVALSPERSQMDERGRADVFRLETTVEGRLGEWIPVGGASEESGDRGGVIGRRATQSGSSSAQFWLRVDPLD